MNTIKLRNGKKIDSLNAATYMDDELREKLHGGNFKTEQQFYRAYCKLHKKTFGETFILDTNSPQI